MYSKNIFPNIFSHIKWSDSKSKVKMEGNEIIGRDLEMVMSIYLNLDYGEGQGLF